MTKRIIIVGSGGFGREVYQWTCDWIDAQTSKDHEIGGFLDIDPDQLNGFEIPVPHLGCEDTYSINENDRFIIAIGQPEKRQIVASKLQAKGGQFFNLIHPTAVVSSSVSIGKGVVVCPFATLCPNTTVGDFALLNIYSSLGHDAVLGACSVMSPYSTLNGFAEVKENVFLGTHAVVVGGRVVGKGSRISAHATVFTDLKPGSTLLIKPPTLVSRKPTRE